MKEQNWIDGLDNIDVEIIENYINQKEKLQRIKECKNRRFRLRLVAACLTITVVSAVALTLWWKSFNVPVWDNAKYSAEEIAALFGNDDNYLGAAVKAYKKIYVNDEKYLYVDELPQEEYLGLYEYNKMGKYPDKDEFQEFADNIMPKIAECTFNSPFEFEIIDSFSVGNSLKVKNNSDDFRISAGQNRTYYNISLMREPKRNISIKGEVVEIDVRLSDDEIISSLDSIKNNLFYIFGASFPDIKIIRYFDGYSKGGTESITVYFYDKSANPLTSVLGISPSDFICIDFYNYEQSDGDFVLKSAGVSYRKCRVDSSKMYSQYAKVKKITLKEAEDLLYKGYVFGGHSCPACMEAQEAVDFEGYDFVDITYINGKSDGYPTVFVPFYTFYKKIGVASNGNFTYAKTYVPAIEVKGYEEYFISQIKNHK